MRIVCAKAQMDFDFFPCRERNHRKMELRIDSGNLDAQKFGFGTRSASAATVIPPKLLSAATSYRRWCRRP